MRAIGLYFRELDGLSAAQLSEAANLLITCYGADVEAAVGDAATDVRLDAEISVLCLSETRNALVCAGYQSDAMRALIVGVVDSRAWPIHFEIRICCVAPACRGAGVGGELLAFALRRAAVKGAAAAVIETHGGARARRFLQTSGFVLDADGMRMRRVLY